MTKTKATIAKLEKDIENAKQKCDAARVLCEFAEPKYGRSSKEVEATSFNYRQVFFELYDAQDKLKNFLKNIPDS